MKKILSFFSKFEDARQAMPYPWRGTFLIVAIAPFFHAPLAYTLLVLFGYQVCAILEQMKREQAKDRMEEVSDTDHTSESEFWPEGGLSYEHQRTLVRVAMMLRRMP
jgi:hypothetical protein